MGGGAWPFLVGGVICLVNSVNKRDLDLLNSVSVLFSSLPIGAFQWPITSSVMLTFNQN